MKEVIPLPSFERTTKRLNPQAKELLAKSLEAFNSFLLFGRLPAGFRFKKINHNKDEVRRYLREYR